MKRRHHPGGVTVRVLVALFGGYALTLFGARAAAGMLPMEGGEAAVTASLAAWLLFLAAAIWAFSARTALHAAWPVIGMALALWMLAR